MSCHVEPLNSVMSIPTTIIDFHNWAWFWISIWFTTLHKWNNIFPFMIRNYIRLIHGALNHTMDFLLEKFQWIPPLYVKPISFQSKASVVCSVTAAIFIDFCLKKLNVFSQHIGQKTNEYLNSAEQIPRNWNIDQLSVLITSWDITYWCSINLLWKE